MQKLKLVAIVVVFVVSYAVPAFAAQTGSDPLAPNVPVLSLGTRSMESVLASAKTLYLRVTAYTSDVNETDDTPFVTAAGTETRDGVVATNLLPFGTKVMIPALFGTKVFTVEDRMAPKKKNAMDIWMPSKTKALYFGANYANVVVLSTSSIVVAER